MIPIYPFIFKSQELQDRVNRYKADQLQINSNNKINMTENIWLNKYAELQKNSDEWKIIQFKLQLSMASTALTINKIHDISNTHVSSSFSSYAKGSIVLQSFIETQKLPQHNNLQKICQKGFDLQEEGMVFNVGFQRNIDIKPQQQYHFVMCKLAVGKSYSYTAQKYRQRPIDCPEGFDSVYLYNQEQNPQIFKHQYAIFKNYQIYPCYLIDFSISPSKEQTSNRQAPTCQNCTRYPPNQSKVYCITQEAYFCYQCDQEHHASPVAKKHNKVQIAAKPKKFGNCSKHENNSLELYCSICCQALCVTCKINGDHVSGEMGNHTLVKLKDAYNDISSKVKQIDPNIQRRKNQLNEDLNKIDLKIKEVNTKATYVQEQIHTMYKKALEQLKVETQKKLSFLTGDQLELKRQYDHIQWMQSFLKHSLQLQQPNDFLHSWYKYSKYKKEILSLTNLSINTQVKADMKLQGNIHVVVESKRKKAPEQIPYNPIYQNQFTPQKQIASYQGTNEKDLGSTQLRKTVFKKHYADKMKNLGSQPTLIKGSYDQRQPMQDSKDKRF